MEIRDTCILSRTNSAKMKISPLPNTTLLNLRELIAFCTSGFNDVIPVLFHKAHMLFSAVNVLLVSDLKIDQEVKHSMEIQKCLLPLLRKVLNVQMYRANYTAFGNKTTSTNLLQPTSFTNLSSKLSQKQLDALIKLIAVHVTQSLLANRDKKTPKEFQCAKTLHAIEASEHKE